MTVEAYIEGLFVSPDLADLHVGRMIFTRDPCRRSLSLPSDDQLDPTGSFLRVLSASALMFVTAILFPFAIMGLLTAKAGQEISSNAWKRLGVRPCAVEAGHSLSGRSCSLESQ